MSKALATIIRKAQAGDMALALRLARKISERKAGGYLTILPSEVSAAVLLGAEQRGELGTAEAVAARDAMLAIVLRQVAA